MTHAEYCLSIHHVYQSRYLLIHHPRLTQKNDWTADSTVHPVTVKVCDRQGRLTADVQYPWPAPILSFLLPHALPF